MQQNRTRGEFIYVWKINTGTTGRKQHDQSPGQLDAGCYTMALSGNLGKAGYQPKQINTTAKVKIEKQGDGFVIPNIDLVTEASVDGINDAEFQKIAEETKKTCPVSQVLSGAEISLNATLKKASAA